MGENSIPYLCTGTFFLLLLDARPEGKSRKERLRQSWNAKPGEKIDNNNQTDVMESLVKIFYPTFWGQVNGFARDVSDIRNCKKSSTINVPLDNDKEIRAFTRRLETQYRQELYKMHKFVSYRLETDSDAAMQKLTQAVLTLIADDEEIGEDEKFYAHNSGEAVTKKELLGETSFCIDSLLLGTWHYILQNRNELNELGKATFEEWNVPVGYKGNQWKFISSIGETYPKEISFFYDEGEEAVPEPVKEEKSEIPVTNKDSREQENHESAESSLGKEKEQMRFESDDEAERIEAEIVFETPRDKEKGPQTTYQIIENYHNYGNGPQIGHVEHFEYKP